MKPGKAFIILRLAVSLSAKHQKSTTVDLVGMRITEASFNWTSTKSSIGSDVMKLYFWEKKKHANNFFLNCEKKKRTLLNAERIGLLLSLPVVKEIFEGVRSFPSASYGSSQAVFRNMM